MAGKKFRVKAVRFDVDEHVSTVVARCEADAFAVLTEILGEDNAVSTIRANSVGRDGGEVRVLALPVDTAMELMRACGKMRGTDPLHRQGGGDIYDSLCWVSNLIEES